MVVVQCCAQWKFLESPTEIKGGDISYEGGVGVLAARGPSGSVAVTLKLANNFHPRSNNPTELQGEDRFCIPISTRGGLFICFYSSHTVIQRLRLSTLGLRIYK